MSGGLSDDIFKFPAAIALAFDRQTRSFVVRPEHPVGVEFEQVILVNLHRSLEWAWEKLHLAEIEGISLHVRLEGDLRLTIVAIALLRGGRHVEDVGQ